MTRGEYSETQKMAMDIRSQFAIEGLIDTRLLSGDQIRILRSSGLFIPMSSDDKQRPYKCWVYVEGRA